MAQLIPPKASLAHAVQPKTITTYLASIGADGPLHPQVLPITFLIGTSQASPAGGCTHSAQGRDGVLALGQALRAKQIWGQLSAWSVTCQLVPWDMGTETVKRGWAALGLVLTLWLPQILSLLVSPVFQRGAV